VTVGDVKPLINSILEENCLAGRTRRPSLLHHLCQPQPNDNRPAIGVVAVKRCPCSPGILDFISGTLPLQQQGTRAGAVFFPDGNRGGSCMTRACSLEPPTLSGILCHAACGNVIVLLLVQRVISQAPVQVPRLSQQSPVFGELN